MCSETLVKPSKKKQKEARRIWADIRRKKIWLEAHQPKIQLPDWEKIQKASKK